jgi:nitrite reductase/ring-hydroxylating ferredoxin subunit
MTLARRALLKAACGGCAALGIAACGGSSPKRAGPGAAQSPSAARAATTGATHPASVAALAKLADIPVGGSVSARTASGDPLLLARPTAKTVVGFSAICTHQGCTVEPAGKQFGCPCHDSTYDAFTGQVLSGPAPAPLHTFAVKVVGTDVLPA